MKTNDPLINQYLHQINHMSRPELKNALIQCLQLILDRGIELEFHRQESLHGE